MVVAAILRIAYDALIANKLRSGLTLLGVIIGVTSVMTIISALEGMQGAIAADLMRLGPATFIIERMGVVTSDDMFFEKIKRKPITRKAVELLEKGCTLCEKIAPRAFSMARVKYGDNSLRDVRISGTPANYIEIVDLDVSQGRFISNEEDIYGAQVAYIGEQIRESLFEGLDPLDKELLINGHKYRIVGVAKKLGAMFGNNQDNFICIPLTAFARQFGEPRRGLNVVVKALSVPQLPEAMDQARAILRAQRHVPFDKEDDFDMMAADNILDILNSLTRILRMGLVGISSISLVVGGIVVMNIMMVSVTERTREIGIRKSLGAKQKHILIQFVFESVMLTLSGGIVGIVFGFFIARALVGMMDMQISPSMLAIIAGLSISTGVGLFFGIYPAMKAARLDPVKALSYE